MPYPNDNKLNIVLSQTSGSADGSGKFPFTERIISGSNLFILTDANGNLTGSTSIPGGSFTNLTVTSLTASFISSSNSIIANDLTTVGNTILGSNIGDTIQITGSTSISGGLSVVGNTTLQNTFVTNLTSSNISASGNISASTLRVENSIVDGGSLTVLGNTVLGDAITDTTRITGSTLISGSLTVIGTIAGTIDSASAVTVSSINTDSTYYVTFVDGTTGVRQLKADTDILSYNPSLNRVTVGNTSGSLLISNDTGTNPNSIALYNSNDNSGATIQVGQPSQNLTASLYVGNQANGFRVLTGQGINTGVITELPVSASNQILFSNTTNATSWTNGGALTVGGGVGIGKNLYVSGSTFLYGDLTIYGTGSVVNISSSTIIIGDNRIQLNAGTPVQRYAGIDVFDSGSGTFTNNVTSSLLWDGLNDNWLLVSNNQTTGNPLTQSSAIMIGGPSGSFGNETLLTVNYIPKVQSTGKNLQNSSLIDNGTLLSYTGTGISASQITASNLTVQYTGSITYATGVYITYTTGSFTTLTITTGSSPGVGAQVPATPTSSGLAGQINVDNNFIYVYTNQVWKRVPLSTWTA
jgi:hypothetical protein